MLMSHKPKIIIFHLAYADSIYFYDIDCFCYILPNGWFSLVIVCVCVLPHILYFWTWILLISLYMFINIGSKHISNININLI